MEQVKQRMDGGGGRRRMEANGLTQPRRRKHWLAGPLDKSVR